MQTATLDAAVCASSPQDSNDFEKFGKLLLPAKIAQEERAKLNEAEFGHRGKDRSKADATESDPLADRTGPRWKNGKTDSAPEWDEPLSSYVGPVLRVINKDELDDYAAVLESQPRDDNHQKIVSMLRTLLPLGEVRKLHRRPREWQTKLDRLEVRFPNFVEAIQHVRSSCALSERAGFDTVTLDNMILSGPPGIGKTYFADFLARFLFNDSASKKALTIRMADQQSNSAIAGSDSFWSNSKPSLIFEELLLKGYANPVVILDELDKATGDSRFDPISGLYTLWERSSATNWKDLSFPFLSIDASRITWIATCNTIRNLPDPIISRAQVFTVAAPSDDEAIAVAEVIVWETLQEYFPDDPIEFSDGAIMAISRLSPRRQRAAIKAALGAVALRQGDEVKTSDIRMEASSTAIGFV